MALVGLEANPVSVEVDIGNGLFAMNIVGLAGKSVQESKERVFSAIRNSGFEMPMKRITINLSPADLVKNSSSYDLPIAVAILSATDQIKVDLNSLIVWGQLSLEGKVLYSNGALAIADATKKAGYKNILLPEINAEEAGIVAGIKILPIGKLSDLSRFPGIGRNGKITVKPRINFSGRSSGIKKDFDFAYVRGQTTAKRVCEIAAAGGHNLLLNGVPGAGKTYISRCMIGILPSMEFEEMIEVTKIYSITGLLTNHGLVTIRPFRNPHHTSSHAALIGGGSIPRPGEVTLAHRGVLFLDEFNEFEARALESLRQPLEDRIVHISRASGVMAYPANFILVAAMNPCKCGFLGAKDKKCTCSQYDIEKYKKKISGPILDRIDLQVFINKVGKDELLTDTLSEASESVQRRVEAARKLQIERYKAYKFPAMLCNADLRHNLVKEVIRLDSKAEDLVSMIVDSMNLSARGYYRLLKVARTIADLEQKEVVLKDHIAEAVSYRLSEM